MSETHIESSCCVVCLICFFCKKSREKTTNVFCRCSDTLLSYIPESHPQRWQVMEKNVYKRAFMINWLQRNAHTCYALEGGWHIDSGRLLSVPLCTDHHTAFQIDWSRRLNMLSDKGIHVDPVDEVKDVMRFFINWYGAFQYSDNSADLKKVQPLPYYPLELRIPISTHKPSFNDIWGYATLTATGRASAGHNIVFYDRVQGMWYQLDDMFPIPIYSNEESNENRYMVGMIPPDVNVNEMICRFRSDFLKVKQDDLLKK